MRAGAGYKPQGRTLHPSCQIPFHISSTPQAEDLPAAGFRTKLPSASMTVTEREQSIAKGLLDKGAFPLLRLAL